MQKKPILVRQRGKAMKEAFVKRTWSTLKPADPISEEEIRKIPPGEVVRITWSRPRNYENHKRFFSFLKTTFEIQDHFTDLEIYRKWIEMKAGHFITAVAPNGTTMFLPKSISFSAMSEDEFQKMFKKCIDVFLSVWGDRISEDELLRVIEFD